jgi:hypothetical protein
VKLKPCSTLTASCWIRNNDATWRYEYFDGFMRALGIEVKDPPKRMRKKLEKRLKEVWTF